MCVPGTITNLIPRPWSNAISCNTIWVMCWTFLRQHYDRPQAQKTQFEITPPQSKLKHRERRWTISKSIKKTNTHLISSCSSHWLQKWAWLNHARQLASVANIFQSENSCTAARKSGRKLQLTSTQLFTSTRRWEVLTKRSQKLSWSPKD